MNTVHDHPYYGDLPPDTHQNSEADSQPFGQSIKIYGTKGALTIQESVSRNGFQTISIDAAKAVSLRKYDWNSKITVQVSKSELPEVVSVLLGFTRSCSFKSHGPDKNKGYEIERQDKNIFIKVFQGGRGIIAVPVYRSDVFWLTNMVLERICASIDGSNHTSVIQTIRSSMSFNT